MPKVIPSASKVSSTAMTGIKAGGLGGLGYGLGMSIGGTLGGAAGSVLAGSVIGGRDGKVLAINGVMDLVAGMFAGGGQKQSQAGVI